MASLGPPRAPSFRRAGRQGSLPREPGLERPAASRESTARRASQPPKAHAIRTATAMPTMSVTGVPDGAAAAACWPPACGAWPPACRRLAGGGRRQPDAGGGRERPHGGLGRRGQAGPAGLDGDLAEHLVGGGGRVPLPVEAEPVGHHHEQPLRVGEGELDAEEARVAGRLPPQLGDRPQVGGRGDDRHPDREAAAGRGGEQVPELHLLRVSRCSSRPPRTGSGKRARRCRDRRRRGRRGRARPARRRRARPARRPGRRGEASSRRCETGRRPAKGIGHIAEGVASHVV